MNVRFIAYVDEIFDRIPAGKRTQDLKEEIIANLDERYDEFLSMGYDDDRAYKATILGLGNIQELIEDLRRGGESGKIEGKPRKHAIPGDKPMNKPLLVTIAVGVLIFTAIMFFGMIVSGEFFEGLSLFMLISGLSVMLLIFCYSPFDRKRRIWLGISVYGYFPTVLLFLAWLDWLDPAPLILCSILLSISTGLIIVFFSNLARGRAVAAAIGTGLYIIATAVLMQMVFGYYVYDTFSYFMTAGVIAAVATCIFIYHFGFKEEDYVRKHKKSGKKHTRIAEEGEYAEVIDYRRQEKK